MTIEEDTSSVNSPENISISTVGPEEHPFVCSIRPGSFQKMSSLHVCFKEKQRPSKCTSGRNAIKRIAELRNQTCKKQLHSVMFRKVSWILLKVNIAFDCVVGLFVVIPWMRNKLNRLNLKTRENKLLLFFFLVWLPWRLQETVQVDTQWRKHMPYFCNVTNTVRYVLEAVMLYTTCYTSRSRYHAVANPMAYRVSRDTGYTRVHAVVIGCTIGILCSITNIIAVNLSADESLGALCMLTVQPTLLRSGLCDLSLTSPTDQGQSI